MIQPFAVTLCASVLCAQGALHYGKREVLVPMRDGTRLFTVIYAPREKGRSLPILLNRTPYGVAPYGPNAYPEELGPSPRFQREGFIFVYQDVRGRMMSGGRFTDLTPHKPRDIDESTDTFDTIQWLLANVPRNNGRVGQWGTSYPGFYAAAGMLDAHPALKAVSPQAPILDWFQGDDFHRNGALWLAHLFNFIVWFGAPRSGPTSAPGAPFSHGTSDGYAFFLGLGPLANANERHFHGGLPFWNEVMAHGNYDEYWKQRNLRPHLQDVKPAVLTVGGWFDAENLFGSLQLFKTLRAQSPTTDTRLVMGPWHHGQWEGDPGEGLGDVRFGSKTSVFFQEEILFPFFMQHLKGAGEAGLPRAMIFNTGVNRWRRLDAWPPETAATRVFFRPGGGLGSATDGGGFDEFVSDPAKPVPFFYGLATGMPVEYMTADQRFVANRPDVLVYRGEPLQEDLTVAGPIRVHLEVSTSGTDADWVVKVVDVYPDDMPDPQAKISGDPLEPPVNRFAGYQQLVRGEVMRGKFRRSLEIPEPFLPGQQTLVEWPLNDVCHTFKKGHRLMVQLQSSWFPLMDRNPQVFMDIYGAKPEDFQKATHRVFLGAKGSFLELPVLK